MVIVGEGLMSGDQEGDDVLYALPHGGHQVQEALLRWQGHRQVQRLERVNQSLHVQLRSPSYQ